MVPMMSPMWPVRAWPRAESSAPGPPSTIPSESRRSPPAAGRRRRRLDHARRGRAAVGVDEVLVLEPEHAAATHGQVAAAGQALGVEPGGPVERFGHRCPPVDDQGLVVRARDGQAADVEGLAQHGAVAGLGQPVDPAEVEGLVPDVELLQPGQARAHDDVALGA